MPVFRLLMKEVNLSPHEYADGLGYFSFIWKFELSLLNSVYCLGLHVKIVLSCSYNFDKLASTCHILFSSFGTQNEILWAQAFWAESRNWIWDFKWNLNWAFKFEPGVQFCRLLSSKDVCYGSVFLTRWSDYCWLWTSLIFVFRWLSLQSFLVLYCWRPSFSGRNSGFTLALSVLWFLRLFVAIYLNILTVKYASVNNCLLTYLFLPLFFLVLDFSTSSLAHSFDLKYHVIRWSCTLAHY